MIETVLVSHTPPEAQSYIGSPSIVRLNRLELLATHDYFGPASGAETSGRTEVYGSIDNGASWQHYTTLHDSFWSSLFVFRNKIYLMGTTKEHGSLSIRATTDGRIWTPPSIIAEGAWHTAPVPVVVWRNRIWRGIEDAHSGNVWPSRYRARFLSAATTSDLLDRASWQLSPALAPHHIQKHDVTGWLEGNVVIGPNDKPSSLIMRLESTYTPNRAAMIRINFLNHTLTDTEFINLPGGTKKFTVRYDSGSKRYLSLTNPVTDDTYRERPSLIRNSLTFVSSRNLKDWNIHTELLASIDTAHHGFQYADWIIDNDDLLAVVRTAAPFGNEQAHNFHDANQLLFFRLNNFRTFLTY